jgi:hypothetical protein
MEMMRNLMEVVVTKKEPEKKKKEDITMQKGFGDLPKLTGKPESQASWRFKMYQYLTKDLKYVEILNWIEAKKGMITEEEINDFEMNNETLEAGDMMWYNSQLWSILTMNCVDEALGQIRNLEDQPGTRGVNAWYRVTKDFRGMSAQRLIGLVERTYAPARIKKIEELPNGIEEWEMILAEYEKHAKAKVPEIVKIWAFRKLVTESL